MSVINQVLLDLDKRKASGAERKVLPDHVRAMPEGAGRSRTGMVWGRGLLVAALVAAAGWATTRSFEETPPLALAPASPAPLNVSARPAEVAEPAQAVTESSPERQIAARLSFELSRLPDPLPEASPRPAAEVPIPAARVVNKTPNDARPISARAEPVVASRAEVKPSGAAAPAAAPSSASVRTASAVAATATPPVEIDKRIREPTPAQLAEGEYRKATGFLHQGRLAEAREGFEAALARHPAHHGARQALLGILVETGRTPEAERAMQEGLQIAPHQIGFAMALARLQMDRGDTPTAIATLQGSLGHAQGNGDYLAFLAGLLQRERRYADAVEQFQAALKVRPSNGVWLLGLGMSLQALKRDAEAREVFRRALGSPALSADLQAFADQRLRQLQ